MSISKMIRYLLLMILICFSAGALLGAVAKTNQTSTDSLAREYHSLRKQHKMQKAGTFDKNLDAWDGRLRVVMEELGKRLGTPGRTRNDVVGTMGKPDTVMVLHDQEGKDPAKDETRLIYFWRGWHDYLFFVCRKDTIMKTEWFYAGE